jgi:hypothetical protein
VSYVVLHCVRVLIEILKLGRAYETLNDTSKRREYDRKYPFIKRGGSCPQATSTPRPPASSTSQSEALSEAAQIAKLRKSKHEREARWSIKKNAFQSSIFELQRDVRKLEQDIEDFNSILRAEVAAEAKKNSWGAWLLSPIYKRAEDTEDVKARKDRERQERRIGKDMKERWLDVKRAGLEKEEILLRKEKEEADAAILSDDRKIQVIENRIRTREAEEKAEREMIEQERMARIRKQEQEQREKREREAAESLMKRQQEALQAFIEQQAKQRVAEMKRQAELQAARQKRQEDDARRRQKISDALKRDREQHGYFDYTEGGLYSFPTSNCSHDGWWPKVQGRTACPRCSEVWTYLLECPGCELQACPRCQSTIRPRLPRGAATLNRRSRPRVRSPSPEPYYNYDWD